MRRALWAALVLLCAGPGMLYGAPGADPRATAELIAEVRAGIDSGDLDGAIRAGERAVAGEARNSMAHDLLGRAYGLQAQESHLLEQVRLARKARALFARAVDLDPSNAAALSDLATYDMRAPAFLGGGMKRARREAERVMELDPSRGHVLLGELALREGNADAAEAEYRQAIAAGPREARGRRAVSSLLVGQRRYGEARQVWIEARALDPSDPVPDYELAGIALACGEGLIPAVDELEDSIGRAGSPEGPRPAELHERLALVYERLGRRPEAATELERAIRLEPHRSEWRKSLARLRK